MMLIVFSLPHYGFDLPDQAETLNLFVDQSDRIYILCIHLALCIYVIAAPATVVLHRFFLFQMVP